MTRTPPSLLLVLLWSALAGAQTKSGSDPLSLPGAVIMCRAMPVTPADSASFVYQFMDPRGGFDQRMSIAAFDSAGKPLYMVISDPGSDSTTERLMDKLAVRFSPFTAGERVILSVPRESLALEGDSSSTSGKKPDPDIRKIVFTDLELARARTLAEWFWTRRCGAPVEAIPIPSPSPPTT